MKKLTKKKFDKLYQQAKKHSGLCGMPIGYIGGVPVMANKGVPKGEIWILNAEEFNRMSKGEKDEE